MKPLYLVALLSAIVVAPIHAQKQQTDRTADGYKGKVKEVTTQTAKLSEQNGEWVEGPLQLNEVVEYDSAGNRVKQSLYDYRGNLFMVRTYSRIDGDKVSMDETIQHDYNPPPVIMSGPPSTAPRDKRFTYKYKYKYDSKGNRLEEAWYHNDASLWLRYVSVYDHKGNEVEWFRYTSTGELNGRSVSIYNPKGQVIEKSWFGPRGELSEKWSYTYEVDSSGNWIKRKASKWVDYGGKFEPNRITYRRITYF
jgi:hypothetical protein